MVYLVDFENVGNDGLCGIENLQPDDKLVIFISVNSNKVNVLGLAQCKAPIYFVYSMVNGCHDYMDFQIATACGMYASNNEDVCIISNDNGYSAVADFCKHNKLFENCGTLFLQSNLQGKTKPPAPEKSFIEKEAERKAEIEHSLTVLQSNKQTALTDSQIKHLKSFIYDNDMPKKKRKERIEKVVGKRKYSQVWNVLAKHFRNNRKES